MNRRAFLAAVTGALFVKPEKKQEFFYRYNVRYEQVQIFGPRVYFRGDIGGRFYFGNPVPYNSLVRRWCSTPKEA